MGEYRLGHSQLELRRLIAQAEVLRPITERLLKSAGIKPGMRILDLGCGAGDVTMLAAELVGPEGAAVGVDRAAEAVALATQRAERAGIRNVVFQEGTETDPHDGWRYDIVIGRYVVIHQPDPVSFIRAALGRLRPGGVLAFHEIDLRKTGETSPAAPGVDAILIHIIDVMRSVCQRPDAAGRLIELFTEAGASDPKLFCERPAAAGARGTVQRWIALTSAAVRTLADPDGRFADPETIEAEIGAELVRARAQLVAPDQVCAWARAGI